MSRYINAYNLGRLPRKSKTYSDDRTCNDNSCSTIISKYNKSDFCNNHKPIKYPRVRGKPLNTED